MKLSRLRLAVRAHGYDDNPPDATPEHVVDVYVNGRELTAQGAGLGMPAWDILGRTHAFAAAEEPRTVPFARCGCGVYGCGVTDVTIAREGDRVRWVFSREVPNPAEALFAADAYDAELQRSLDDRSWECPGETAGRLVRERLDVAQFAVHGLTPVWAGPRHNEPAWFEQWFDLVEDEARYQIFVGVRASDDPAATADRLLALLDLPPARWEATWHPNTSIKTPPRLLAGTGVRLRI